MSFELFSICRRQLHFFIPFLPSSMPPPREWCTTPLIVDIDGQQLSTTIDPDSGTHYIDCHRCGDSITLTITGHPCNFYNHINGNVCKKNLSRGQNRQTSIGGTFILQTSPSSASESQISLSHIGQRHCIDRIMM